MFQIIRMDTTEVVQDTVKFSIVQNPLTMLSSFLDWGLDGRYPVSQILAEEKFRAEPFKLSDENLSTTYLNKVKTCKKLRFSSSQIDSSLANFAVGSVVNCIVKSKPVKDNRIRPKEGYDIKRFARSSKEKRSPCEHKQMNRKKTIKRNVMPSLNQIVTRKLFVDKENNLDGFVTPHKLDRCLLPQNLSVERQEDCAVIRKCDLCGQKFWKLSSFRIHQATGDCKEADAPIYVKENVQLITSFLISLYQFSPGSVRENNL